MPKLKDITTDVESAELLKIFVALIETVAYGILFSESPPAPDLAWAKRAIFEFGNTRSQWYANHVIRGLAATSDPFRTLVQRYKATNGDVEVTTQQINALVQPCIAKFIASGI